MPARTAGTGILVLQPGPEGVDAYVDSVYPNQNYGNHTYMYGIGLPWRVVGFLRFDLTALPGDAIVSLAELELWGSWMDGQFLLSPLATSWNESTVSWANQPAAVTPPMTLSYPISRGEFTDPCYFGCVRSFDVTSIVQAWVTGALVNHGFKVAADTPGYGWMVATGDCTADPRPLLRITYESSTPAAARSWGGLKTLYR